jgi:septal ring factor EnvC (AmiA/AmiB activator)
VRRALLPLLLALALPAAAQAPRAGPSARDELARVEAEQRQREQLRDQQKGEAEETRREIAELTAQLAELNAAQGEGRQLVGERRLRLAALNAREAELVARMGANANDLSRLLGALQTFSRNPPPALFVNPRDARNAVRAAILVRAVTPELERRAAAFSAQADEIKTARRQAAAAAGSVLAAESDVADRAARIEALLMQKTALERSLTTEVVAADQTIARLAERAAALRAVVRGLPPPPVVRTTLARLTPPVSAAPIRRFGEDERGGPSEGWVWRPAPGAGVAAPAAGIVEYAGPVDGWNNVVIIAAGGGHHLVLSGLGALAVKPGQSVAAGQTIARMATDANLGLRSSEPELRLEIRKDGRAVDPARFMPGR